MKAHVEAMRIAHAVHLLRPFHGGGKQEIISRPKCYAFDTGFVTHERGWDSIRDDDRGLLWEHLVLDALRLRFAEEDVLYWQDKARREVDFVIRRPGGRVDAVECKINPDKLNPAPIAAFRQRYPLGRNYVATPLVREPSAGEREGLAPRKKEPYAIRRGGLEFTVCSGHDIA